MSELNGDRIWLVYPVYSRDVISTYPSKYMQRMNIASLARPRLGFYELSRPTLRHFEGSIGLVCYDMLSYGIHSFDSFSFLLFSA